MYEIAADNLELMVSVLLEKNITQFALRLRQGTARLKRGLKLHTTDTTRGLDVVIAGQFSQGWMGMSQPPTTAQLTTHIDLAASSFLYQGGLKMLCAFKTCILAMAR